MNAACAPGACYNDISVKSCTCSSGFESVEEDGKQICRIGDVRCGAEVTYAGRNGTGKLQFGHTVHYSCEGVLVALTQWSVGRWCPRAVH